MAYHPLQGNAGAELSGAYWQQPGDAVIEIASRRATRLGGVLARRRPPTASLSSRRMPEPNTGDRNSHGSSVDEFGPQNCVAVPRTSLQDEGAARMIEDYYDFPMGLDF
jgi:hypothetical protein